MVAFFLTCAMAGGFPLATVARGSMSSIDEPYQAVVRSQADWTALWARHGAGQPVPFVDFGARMVVGVFLGSKPTAGYAVEIVQVQRDGGGLVVEYRETAPAADRMVAQVITAPFHLVSFERQDGAVKFVKR